MHSPHHPPTKMAQRQRQFRAIRNDPNLARFVVEGRATGKQLGTGSYGSVEEVEVNGLICAGKKLHDVLIDTANAGVENIAGKYVQECQLMSDLRHPNITQFLGVCFLPNCQLPVLLMERLNGSLDDLLETIPNIPLALKRSILEDVSRGLLYLHKHTPQIIHRDMTAKNVLLTTSFVAKITDFGNSRIVNLQPGQLARTLSRLPGTMLYMPPEALSVSSRYGPSLDVFSFGHLTLFTLLQVFPGDLLEHNYTDPDNPGRLLGRTEVERRQPYFDRLREGNAQLVELIKTCLHNDSSQRPTAEQLVTALEGMRGDIEGPCGKLAIVDAVRQVMTAMALKEKSEEKLDELAAKEEEIQRLQRQVETASETYQAELRQKDEEMRRKNTQLEQLQVENELVIQERAAQVQQLREKDDRLRQREAEFSEQLRLNEAQAAQLRQNAELLQLQNADISKLQSEVQRLQESLKQLESEGRLSAMTPPSELKLKWRRGKDLPFPMSNYPSMVTLRGIVYIGGGFTENDIDRSKVITYDPLKDTYNSLPPYAYCYFSMAVVNNQLILVGGVDVHDTRKKTNKLGVWNEQSQRWTRPFPPMTTACRRPTVVTHNDRWLVVIGGEGDGGNNLSRVEILDTSSKQWLHSTPMPQIIACVDTLAATIGNMCYLLGGYTRKFSTHKRVVSVCLDDLVSQAVSQPVSENAPPTPSPWQTLPDTPFQHSTPLALNGALLAVGGGTQFINTTKAIHMYLPMSKEWVKTGEMPAERAMCSCIILPSGEIMVIGAELSFSHVAQQMHLATVQSHVYLNVFVL